MTYAERGVGLVVGRVVSWTLVAAAVGAGLYYGVGRYRSAKASSAPPQYFSQPATVGPVTLTAVGSGTFAPAFTEDVAPRVSGTVTQVDAQVGQSVKAGQTLFQLSDTQGLADKVATAQAALGQAEHKLQQLQDPAATVDPRTVQSDQIKVQQAQVTLSEAKANLAAAQAAAAQAADASTPVGGTVTSLSVAAGDQVTAGTAIATVRPSGAPTVTVSVPQPELAYLPVGTTATVSASGLGTATGTVTAWGPVASASSSGSGSHSGSGTSSGGGDTYPLTVTLAATGADLPSGADVTVSFTPQGTPPAGDSFSDTGTVGYPSPFTVTAHQAGTVSDLTSLGATVAAGQRLATVTPPADAPSAVSTDTQRVQQDENSLTSAQLTLQQDQSPLPASAQAIAAQQGAVQSAEEALSADQQSLSDLTVVSPIAGVVQSVAVQTGDQLQADAPGVTLAAGGALDAVVYVDELDIDQVKPGQQVTATIGAYPNQQFTGKVVSIDPSPTTQFGVAAYGVHLALNGLPADLRSGMTVNATILIASVKSTLRVPTWSVTSIAQGRGIVRVMQNGRPVPTQVQTGLSGTQWTQITSGLQAGTPVVAGDAAAANTTNGGAFFAFAARGGARFRGPGGGGGARGG